jgi:hypothetical protein
MLTTFGRQLNAAPEKLITRDVSVDNTTISTKEEERLLNATRDRKAKRVKCVH